ncbi:MAG: dodecin domain-containing protein, partial [Candidatus Odyssella sp.]|nr:dodecin domain-containing protein [Candidatus Odyssella sp.]
MEERSMASKEGVYRITEIVGTSKTSWEDATKNA